jgi:hypothetical protein
MIRRRVGEEFWLIPQHDHALLSGELARQFGNEQYAIPTPSEETIEGISLHDCGWPIHDDQPMLNSQGFPIDVFESTPEIGLRVWTESSKRAVAKNPYTGLLVSLHGLSLSGMAVSQAFGNEKFDPKNPRVRFEVNKFQHAQLELQEKLRKQLGLRLDIPMHLGLAGNSTDSTEQNLIYNFRLLQAMDKLSLCICCSKPPFTKIEPITNRPGGTATWLRIERPEPQTIFVSPWPFKVNRIEVAFPFRRLPVIQFESTEAFQETYLQAKVESFSCSIERQN